MNPKTLFAFVALLATTSITFSQSLSRSNLSTAGGMISNNTGLDLSWTIGEVFSETIESNLHVTGGFQQGELTSIYQAQKNDANDFFELDESQNLIQKSKDENFSKQVIQVFLFPNPSINDLWVKSNSKESKNFTVRVLDLSGRYILEQYITLGNFQKEKIQNINNLNSGNYILSFFQKDKLITSQKFTKI